MRVLHVLNYGWPSIDGYVARSIGLITAQQRHLDLDVHVAVSPFAPLTEAVDRDFTTACWGPDHQLRAGAVTLTGEPVGPRRWERPGVGLSPVTGRVFARELRAIVERLKPDLVHTHHPHYVAGPALRVAARCGLPGVYEIRCLNGDYDLDAASPDPWMRAYHRLRGRWQNAREYALCRRASAVVTISERLKRRIERAAACPGRVHVVRNSVDIARFQPAPRARRADGVLRVGYATTFEAIENLDSAIQAAAIAAPQLAQQGIRLEMALAGTGRDFARIQGLVAEAGLEDTVRLPGFVPYRQMPDFYHALDLFLVPRRVAAVAKDTTPLKPLEALACGLPLLASDLPAMRELLGGRTDVRFIEPSPAAIAEGLVRFVREPWGAGAGIAERSWSSEVGRYHEIYREAIAAGPPNFLRTQRWLRPQPSLTTPQTGSAR